MTILSYVERLALADAQDRRAALLAILRELNAPWMLHREEIEHYTPENIIVRLGQTTPRLVLGAHYDAIPGSTGANDNAAGVAILLSFLRAWLRQPLPLSCDVVFFDCEECGSWGSRAYVRRFAAEPIMAMINLDVCGVGDTLLVGPRRQAEAWPIQAALQLVTQQQATRLCIVEELPPGDEGSFEAIGIPNLAISMMPQDDVLTFLAAVPALRQLRPCVPMPAIAETIHNGPRDAIAVIEEVAMQTVLKWFTAIVQAFSCISGATWLQEE